MILFHFFSLLICIFSLCFCIAFCSKNSYKYVVLMFIVTLVQFINFLCALHP